MELKNKELSYLIKRIMKRFIFIFILPFVFAELYLDFASPVMKVDSYMNSVLSKVWFQKKTNLAMPPFNLILNAGWDNPKRLEDVYKYAHWPASTDYIAQDFLRFHSAPYKIHINSMGFRGPEVSKVKPKNTFRVLAYGAYMTFGEAVNDDETYLSQAEREVNKKLHSKKVEILNGGMESATFILGLSRLQHELESSDADAVLFEYGFLDAYQVEHDKIADNYNTLIGHPELEPTLSQNSFEKAKYKLYSLYGYTEFWLYKSKVYTAIREKILNNTGEAFEVGFSELKKALTTTSKQLKAKGKIVFIVINPVLPKDAVEALTEVANDSGAVLVNGKKFFRENPPSEQMLKNFDTDPNNFLREIGFERKEIFWKKSMDLKTYAPYYQNLFQLSSLGHKLMGQLLANRIEHTIEALHKK